MLRIVTESEVRRNAAARDALLGWLHTSPHRHGSPLRRRQQAVRDDLLRTPHLKPQYYGPDDIHRVMTATSKGFYEGQPFSRADLEAALAYLIEASLVKRITDTHHFPELTK